MTLVGLIGSDDFGLGLTQASIQRRNACGRHWGSNPRPNARWHTEAAALQAPRGWGRRAAAAPRRSRRRSGPGLGPAARPGITQRPSLGVGKNGFGRAGDGADPGVVPGRTLLRAQLETRGPSVSRPWSSRPQRGDSDRAGRPAVAARALKSRPCLPRPVGDTGAPAARLCPKFARH